MPQANVYQVPLVSADVIAQANMSWSTPTTGCRDQMSSHVTTEARTQCVLLAQSIATITFLPARWVYDIRDRAPDWRRCCWAKANHVVNGNFALTGDWMRTSIPDLDFVINSGVRVTLYDGDADYILNYYASRQCSYVRIYEAGHEVPAYNEWDTSKRRGCSPNVPADDGQQPLFST
ncbi:Alpha/Beta hydrolase protein [Mycena alexandri]|uniref:Alpha/Beta hydrolase protein n=1 Tax=Mycena alexandri TaxID=1745969 RepID=A0AAD6RWD2_9AGAR|nr:Alpha/Beta hydrolase protein [Mycena alexandri]